MKKFLPAIADLTAVVARDHKTEWRPTDDEIAELMIRSALYFERAKIRRGAYGGSAGSEQRRSADHFARKATRRQLNRALKALKVQRPKNLTKSELLAKCQPSAILDGLMPDRQAKWRPIVRRRGLTATAVSR